jgi:hypothetical protein
VNPYNHESLGTPEIASTTMTTTRQIVNVNPTSEHGVYLRLFITNGGGW